jgi:GNAT superfamily N-acetyltransferase
MSSNISPEITEGLEAEFMFQYVSHASAEARHNLGIATKRAAGGVILSLRNDESRYWSKALGFGFSEPITDELVEQVLDYYRSEDNSTAVMQIAPSVLPPEWDAIRARHGLVQTATIIKLACAIDDFRWHGRSDLTVEGVDDVDIDAWARVALRGFGMPESLATMVAAGTRSSGFHPFAAWDGDEMIAAANMFIRGDVASLNTGATLSTHRNKGAQSALIAERARYAERAGCRWLVAETGQPALGTKNPSLDNLLRAGFTVQYTRVDWTWRADRHDS